MGQLPGHDIEDDDSPFDSIDEVGDGSPLAKRSKGANTIDFTDILALSGPKSSHQQLILMALLLAVKDKASEVRFEPAVFEPGEHGLLMYYRVDGEDHELVPPPAYLARFIVEEFKTIAGLHSARHRLAGVLRRLASKIDGQARHPSRGHFRMRCGDIETDISATVYGSTMGDGVILGFSEGEFALSEAAQGALKTMFEHRTRRP